LTLGAGRKSKREEDIHPLSRGGTFTPIPTNHGDRLEKEGVLLLLIVHEGKKVANNSLIG